MSTLKLGNIGSLVTYDSSIQKMVSHKDIEIVIVETIWEVLEHSLVGCSLKFNKYIE